MAYIHQRSLQRARSNLYKLGKSDRPRQRVEDAAAGMMGNLMPGPPAKMTEEQKREEMKRRIYEQAFMQQMQQREQEEGIKRAVEFDKTNRLAESAPIGGKYTQSGLDKAVKEAELNGQDRILVKQFLMSQGIPLGMGGTPTGFLS